LGPVLNSILEKYKMYEIKHISYFSSVIMYNIIITNSVKQFMGFMGKF
jgi:hypothetical protein